MTTLKSVLPSKTAANNALMPLVTAINGITPDSIPLNCSPYWDKQLPPGLDIHLDKDEVIAFYKLNKTLIHKKNDTDSEDFDRDFPEPVYISPRKPVWILSELIAWQESLKAKRKAGGGK